MPIITPRGLGGIISPVAGVVLVTRVVFDDPTEVLWEFNKNWDTETLGSPPVDVFNWLRVADAGDPGASINPNAIGLIGVNYVTLVYQGGSGSGIDPNANPNWFALPGCESLPFIGGVLHPQSGFGEPV